MAVSELDKYEGRSSNRNSRDVPKPRKKKIDRDSSDASSDGSYASSSKSSSKRSTSTRRSRKSYSMGDRPMRLMNYRFVPTYQRRPWIFNGYRPTMDFFDALKTMFSIHNETGLTKLLNIFKSFKILHWKFCIENLLIKRQNFSHNSEFDQWWKLIFG